MKILFDLKKAHLKESKVRINIFRYLYVFLVCEWLVLPYLFFYYSVHLFY